MGFSGPLEDDVVQEMGLPVVPRGRFKGLDANERDYRVAAQKVFAAGDIRRGQSLVVWAIREGRQAARHRPLPDGPHGSAALGAKCFRGSDPWTRRCGSRPAGRQKGMPPFTMRETNAPNLIPAHSGP